jgi:hypothetical protein
MATLWVTERESKIGGVAEESKIPLAPLQIIDYASTLAVL